MSRILISICISLLLASTSYATVIGNWESGSTGDGWLGWSNGQTSIGASWPGTTTIGSVTYTQSTIGATLGSDSLQVTDTGWNQCLAAQLSPSQIATFMADSKFSIDMSEPSSASIGHTGGGYSQLNVLYMNAPGAGWTQISGASLEIDWWDGSPAQTKTLSVDYSAFKSLVTPNPSYVQIIFALNNGGGAPSTFYFDNAQLTPEPATMALLGLGGLALIRRKR